MYKLGKNQELTAKCLFEYFTHVRPHDMGNFAEFVMKYEALSKEPNPVYPGLADIKGNED
jgi:hypothetical protein